MPYIRTPEKGEPRTKQLDLRAQRSGLRHTVFSPNGDQYTGEWLDDRKHGKGTQLWRKSGSMYRGEWKRGRPDGFGTYSELVPGTNRYHQNYCGKWKDGKKHGPGTFFYSDSAIYEGDWSEDQRNGWGRMYHDTGDIYEGQWLRDKCHGQGIIQFVNGNWFEGTWRDGCRNGEGKFFYSDKGQLYQGFWVDGVAKCGTLTDCGREKAKTPTKYPIPKLHLVDAELVLKEAQSLHGDQQD